MPPRPRHSPRQTAYDPKTARYFLMRGLLHAFYWMDESMQNHMEAAGVSAVSRSQSMIMSNIADGVTRPADLARRLGISRQAVQQLLADMQERKLIDLVPDPDDARAKIVRYSARGRNLGEISLRALDHIDAVLADRLGRKDLTELCRILVEKDWGDPVTVTAAEMSAARPRKAPSLESVIRRAKR
jgi:DNA-binding MarR family transcriptional regulator